MGSFLKRRDVLVSPQSKATEKDIEDYLISRLKKLEDGYNGDGTAYYYATVFDSRTNEYFYFYSNRAVNHYDLGKNRFDVVTKDNVTRKNFMHVFIENIKDIVTALKTYFSFGAYKIKTCSTVINDDAKIDVSEAQGDIVNNSVFVKIDPKEQEEVLVEINENKEIIFEDKYAGKEVLLTYLIKDE